MNRKRLGIVLLGLGVAGLAVASAATLGDVESNDIGAGVGVVASCTSDGVDVSYSTEFSGGEYVIDEVTVDITEGGGVCDGQDLSLTLMDDSSGDLGSGSAGVSGDSATVTGLSASAASVVDVSVVITG